MCLSFDNDILQQQQNPCCRSLGIGPTLAELFWDSQTTVEKTNKRLNKDGLRCQWGSFCLPTRHQHVARADRSLTRLAAHLRRFQIRLPANQRRFTDSTTHLTSTPPPTAAASGMSQPPTPIRRSTMCKHLLLLTRHCRQINVRKPLVVVSVLT